MDKKKKRRKNNSKPQFRKGVDEEYPPWKKDEQKREKMKQVRGFVHLQAIV